MRVILIMLFYTLLHGQYAVCADDKDIEMSDAGKPNDKKKEDLVEKAFRLVQGLARGSVPPDPAVPSSSRADARVNDSMDVSSPSSSSEPEFKKQKGAEEPVSKQARTENVRKFLEKLNKDDKAKVINAIKDRRSLIQKALITKNMELVRLLIEHGANIFLIPPGGNSSFHLAIYDINILKELIQTLKDMGLDKQIPVECGKVVYYAIFEKKFECLEFLLEEGNLFHRFINIDIMNVTPLHVGFGEGNPEAVKTLLDRGADWKKPVQKDGIYPVHVMAAKGNHDAYKHLMVVIQLDMAKRMKNGELPSFDDYLTLRTKETKMTPKHFASFRGNWRVLDEILKKTLSDLDWQSASGMAAIHYGVSEAHDSVVATLLPFKPNIFLEDRNGNNTIVYAGFKNRYHCGVLLINYLNQHKYELENSPKYKRDLLLDKKIWLVLSVVDTTKVIEVNVHHNPTWTQFMEDMKNIRCALFDKAIDVESKNIKWKKFELLHLKYKNEDNIFSKGSGILRNFLLNGAQLLFSNEQNLFMSNDGGRSYGFAFQENEPTEEMLENVRLIGLFTALATLTNPTPIPFKDYIFKAVAGEELTPSDFVDADMFNFWKTMDELSSEELQEFNIPNCLKVNDKTTFFFEGGDVVTKGNFAAFKANVVSLLSRGGHQDKLITAFKEGFFALLPKHFLHIQNDEMVASLHNPQLISAEELKALISEIPIDLAEWKEFTSYVRCDENTKEVKWFWEFVRNADDAKRRKLLAFATGSPLLPIGGFKYLKSEKIPFTIELISNDGGSRLPSARTCVYTIALPATEDQETFNKNLETAIECEGFDFV